MIELVVVVGIIGILVLIASSNFSGQTKDAKHKAALADMKIVADATEMYNVDNEDWPRLTDVPYTSEQLERYSENFYDNTGKKVKLAATGNYYDIDYDKLSEYAKAPVNKENYIIQNPVGKIFYVENLSEDGKSRVDYSTNKQANLSVPSQLAVSDISDTSAIVTSDVDTEVKVGSSEWQPSGHKFTGLSPETEYVAYARFTATETHLASEAISESFTTEEPELYEFTKHTFTNAGQAGRTGPSQSQLNNTYRGSEVEGYVTSDNGIQLWAVPKTGTYRIEAYGARGANTTNHSGGKGAVIRGDLTLSSNDKISILVGQKGSDVTWGGSGGGGTFVTMGDTPLIVAGGGGGSTRRGMNGLNATTSTSGTNSSQGRGRGGVNGSGGKTYSTHSGIGGAGGGFYGNGANGGSYYGAGSGGLSFMNGGLGGVSSYSPGGFGGGGGGTGYTPDGGAGGGGYSGGGGGGGSSSSAYGSGGGGGSYNSGANQANSVGNTGHGKVVITYIGD